MIAIDLIHNESEPFFEHCFTFFCVVIPCIYCCLNKVVVKPHTAMVNAKNNVVQSTILYRAGYVKYMYRRAVSCTSLLLIRAFSTQPESCPAGPSATAEIRLRHE